MPFINIQGMKIFYLQNAQFLKERTSVIFIHGAGGKGENWAYQLAGIEGYNLIALDLPGHGQSDGTPANSISEYCEFIWSFVLALGIEQYIIAGHSMGGAIAMEFALIYPNALKALIVVDSGARLRVNPRTLEVLKRGEHPTDAVTYFYSGKVSDSVLKHAIDEMKTVPTQVFLADFIACDRFNIMDRIKEINLPTLLICGEEDQMTPVNYSNYLARELGKSTISIIKNAGHMTMLEQPDSVNEVVRDFFDGLC